MFTHKAVSIVAATLLAAGITLAAQERQEAWPRRQPMLDAGGHVRDEMFARAPLGPGDEKYADIDGYKMKDVVRDVVAISLKTKDDKTRYWGRIAGTSGEAMAADWVEAGFKKAGLTVTRREFALPPQWFPLEWGVSFESGGKSMTFPSLLPASRSKPTPAAGVDLEVIWVGTGTAADFAGRDVKGKAVLIHSIPAPGRWATRPPTKARSRAPRRKARPPSASSTASPTTSPSGRGSAAASIRSPFLASTWAGRTAKGARDAREGAAVVKMRLKTEERTGLKSQSVVRHPARRDRRRNHRHGAHGRLLRGGARQRVGPLGDDGAGRSLREGSQGAAPPQHPVHRPAGHHAGSRARAGCTRTRRPSSSKTVLIDQLRARRGSDHKYWLVDGQPDLRMSNLVSPRRWWVYGSPTSCSTSRMKPSDVQRRPHRRHGSARVGRDGDHGARPAVHSGHPLAGDQAHRCRTRPNGCRPSASNRSRAHTPRSSTR